MVYFCCNVLRCAVLFSDLHLRVISVQKTNDRIKKNLLNYLLENGQRIWIEGETQMHHKDMKRYSTPLVIKKKKCKVQWDNIGLVNFREPAFY